MTSQFMRLVVRPAADVTRLIAGMRDYSGQWQATPEYGSSWQERPAEPETRRSRWSALDEEPDNLIMYPGSRNTGYGTRRAAAR